MEKINVPAYSTWMKALDKALEPIMYLIGGFDKSWMQETHAWHSPVLKKEELKKIDLSLNAMGGVDHNARFWGHPNPWLTFGLMHMTIFGGWNKYMVFEVDRNDYDKYWTSGWIAHKTDDPKSDIMYAQFQNKPIYDNRIRFLKSPHKIFEVYAVNDKGMQIKVKKIDEGVKGDGRYGDVRLF